MMVSIPEVEGTVNMTSYCEEKVIADIDFNLKKKQPSGLSLIRLKHDSTYHNSGPLAAYEAKDTSSRTPRAVYG